MTHPALFLDTTAKPFAHYSPCRSYRYLLGWPTYLQSDRQVLFVMANPSTATEHELDPTVTRCYGYAKAWGYGWCLVVNVRAWRETNPKKVPTDPLAIGPQNDDWIRNAVRRADLVVCGWGKLGGTRGPDVLRVIRQAGKVPHALKLNKDGSPCHPLYLAAKLVPFPIEDIAGILRRAE